MALVAASPLLDMRIHPGPSPISQSSSSSSDDDVCGAGPGVRDVASTSSCRPKPRRRPIPDRRCWTCIDRKVRCDRGFPVCASCTRSKRICHGYGLRLSWPQDHDRKRLIVAGAGFQSRGKIYRRSRELHMIHTTPEDMELYRYMTVDRDPVLLSVCAPTLSPLSHLSTDEKILLHYFQNVVADTLNTVGGRPLGSVLVRVVMSDSTPSSGARQALLAFASLYRNGLHLQAAQLKLSSLRALSAAATRGLRTDEMVPHIAASILLCAFEILQHFIAPYSLTGEWVSYITSARSLVNGAPREVFEGDSSILAMVEWLHYHETMERIARVHWQPEDTQAKSCQAKAAPSTMRVPLRQEVIASIHNRSMSLLTDVCNTLRPSTDPVTYTDEYKTRVSALRLQAEHDWIPSRVTTATVSAPTEPQNRRLILTELHALTTLIYLFRASGDYLTDGQRINAWAQRGLRLITALGTCERTLPLLIIGSEARADEDRVGIMEVLDANERSHPSRARKCLRQVLFAAWNQDDLHAERDLKVDYMERLTAVISRADILPPFE